MPIPKCSSCDGVRFLTTLLAGTGFEVLYCSTCGVVVGAADQRAMAYAQHAKLNTVYIGEAVDARVIVR